MLRESDKSKYVKQMYFSRENNQEHTEYIKA